MAAERHFEAAAEGGALDRGDDRLRRLFHGVERLDEAGRHRRLAEFADVRAGDEGAAFAGDHDGLDRVVGHRLLDAVLQALADVERQRIDGRIVDDDERGVAARLVADALGEFGHRACLLCLLPLFYRHGRAPRNGRQAPAAPQASACGLALRARGQTWGPDAGQPESWFIFRPVARRPVAGFPMFSIRTSQRKRASVLQAD